MLDSVDRDDGNDSVCAVWIDVHGSKMIPGPLPMRGVIRGVLDRVDPRHNIFYLT